MPLLLSTAHAVEQKVMTFNVKGLPFSWLDQGRYEAIGLKFNEMRQKGEAPEIVALQEAFDPATDAIMLLSGYPYSAKGPKSQGTRVNSGLVIMSEYPILKTNSMIYRDCIGFDCLSIKSILHTRIQVPGLERPLDMYTTHLNADPDMPGTPREDTEYVRLKQTQEAVEFIFRTWDQKNPLIIAADFNFHPIDWSYQFFKTHTQAINAVEKCMQLGTCSGDQDHLKYWQTSFDHQFYHPGRQNQITVTPTYYKKRFTEKFNGKPFSDHVALENHYSITQSAP